MKLSNIKWKSLVALAVVWIAIFMNWNWIWGFVFLIWVIPEIKHRTAYFVEPVDRSSNPFSYWLIIFSWILMALYMIITGLSPRFNPESAEFVGYKKYHAQSAGFYTPNNNMKPKTIMVTDLNNTNEPSVKVAAENDDKNNVAERIGALKQTLKPQEKDSLIYKTFNCEEMHFVGISTVTSFNEDQIEKDLQEVWEYFLKEDISYVINDIVDPRIFVVYSDYDKEYDGYFTVTVGYMAASADDVYEGLSAVTVSPSTFAVLESDEKGENAVAGLWERVLCSDLKRKNDFDIEAYTLNDEYEVVKTELMTSIMQ